MRNRKDRRTQRTGLWAITLLALAVAGMTAPSHASAEGNQVFLRGGWAALNSDRSGEGFTDTFGLGGSTSGASQGYYIGAGLDLLMHKNFLGFQGMSLVGEIGLEFKRFTNSNTTLNVIPTAVNGVAGTNLVTNKNIQVTMLTVDVAPKLKFREGHKLRPWIIPVGLDFHVISPPSTQANYLDIGVQWGAGVEYNIWGPLNVGLDGRYHLAANMTNTVNNFGTVGMYLGILY